MPDIDIINAKMKMKHQENALFIIPKNKRSSNEDLAPAKGILNALLISILFNIIIGFIIYKVYKYFFG